MSDVLSFVEIDGQHVELLPARTVLSLFSVGDPGAPAPAPAPAGGPVGGDAGNGGAGGTTGPTHGKAGFLHNWIYVEGDMHSTLTGAAGGAAPGGAATGGAGAAAPAAPAS